MDDMLNHHTLSAAPVWKQAMLTLLTLFPGVMLETFYLFPQLIALHPVVARFLGAIAIVCTISWVLMPGVLYFLGWWLRPNSRKQEYVGLFIVLGIYLLEISFFLFISQ